jgi:hypothetical protein
MLSWTNALFVLAFPVFFTTSVYVMIWPVATTVPDAGVALLVTEIWGDATTGYVTRLLNDVYVVPAMLVLAVTDESFEMTPPSTAGLLTVTVSVKVTVEFDAIDPML